MPRGGMLRCWPTETWVECLVCRSYWTAETLGELCDRLRLSRELAHAR
ncbi:hypothetical protein [Catellatospora tritici]|nr:hypothetical protein [Catellatospora tritici]MBV1854423.1 hypothetical protein [Catellatospora tritici]